MTSASRQATQRLSLVLCSRNDEYMGDSRGRLETSLNYFAARTRDAGWSGADVEVIVADWGSEVPLSEVLRLSPEAAALVSFVLVPPSIALELQQDSPFPEVLALNAAARRSQGEYIGRIDQDTLVSARFLETFDRLYTGEQPLAVPMHSALLFSQRRDVPFAFASRSPSLWAVTQFIRCFKPLLRVERRGRPWYATSVGIWLTHRDVWHACGGYDERMIYMNTMERNMIERLTANHELVNLGELVDYGFYHLDHYSPPGGRKSSRYRKVNPDAQFENPETLNPNASDWGLASYDLPILPACEAPGRMPVSDASLVGRVSDLVRLVVITGAMNTWYALIKLVHPQRWDSERGVEFRRRVETARHTVSGQPPYTWPTILRRRWNVRASKPSGRR